MSALTEINAQIKEHDEKIAALRAQVEAIRSGEKVKVIEELRAKIAEYGITAADLRLKLGRGGAGKAAAPSQPVAVKYRSETGEMWSGGRGRKPRWVVETLAAGKSLADFEVAQS